jgi:hypothetical protein
MVGLTIIEDRRIGKSLFLSEAIVVGFKLLLNSVIAKREIFIVECGLKYFSLYVIDILLSLKFNLPG